jgi:hypothetical protein
MRCRPVVSSASFGGTEDIMTTKSAAQLRQLEEDGYTLVPRVLADSEVEAIRAGLSAALAAPEQSASIRSQSGSVYAARNVLAVWPPAAQVWRVLPLAKLLRTALGKGFGLVRALYFDKPPDQTWALPWHKDLTIAVRDNQLPSRQFSKPTRKAGVPHVEAPRVTLDGMLTARIHLDRVTEENGPLRVIPGSHRDGKEFRLGDVPPRAVLAEPGDVLLMRPLVVHCSNRSHPETDRHRRILHLEFAASPELPDAFAWHEFIRGE